MSPGKKRHIFTVDIEDDVNLLYQHFTGKTAPPTDAVVRNTQTILELLEANRVRATFFVLGQIARHYPDLVKEMAEAGHEIGTHGVSHRPITQLSPEEFRTEIRESKALLEQIVGKPVVTFRAPSFTITKDTLWALDVLVEEGIQYDSSIYPIRGKRYGIPDFGMDIQLVRTPSGSIVEVPLSCTEWNGRRIPCCGGGYNRLFPFKLNHSAFRAISSHRPVVFYTHPYELDSEKPGLLKDVLKTLSFKQRLHYRLQKLNRGSVKRKLTRFLENYEFAPMTEIADEILNAQKELRASA